MSDLPPLPKEFLFGVATADHQSEAFDAACPDIWDAWEARWKDRGRFLPRGRATDFWNRYAEDVERAKGLGCRVFRFSVAWARIEPRPGEYDQAALEHYRGLAEAIRAAGMKPMVTLLHFVWPLHVQRRGQGEWCGLLADDFPETFAAYARTVARSLGPVPYWIPVNEPSQLVHGFFRAISREESAMPPGFDGAPEQQAEAIRRLMNNLFRAHTRAREEIRRLDPAARVSSNPLLLGLPRWLQWGLDLILPRLGETALRLTASAAALASRVLAPLEAGAADVVLAAMSITPERAREITFSRPYFTAHQRLLVPVGSPIAGAESLNGAVAVVRTSTAEAVLERFRPAAFPHRVETLEAGLEAITSGAAVALLSDDAILEGLEARHPGRYTIVGEGLSDERYAAAVMRGNPVALGLIDEAVREVVGESASPEASALEAISFAPEAPPVGRDDALLRRIRARRRLVVAVRDGVPRLDRPGPDGRREALEAGIASAIARRIFADAGITPQRISWRVVCTPERAARLRAGNDLLCGLSRWLEGFWRQVQLTLTCLNSNWWHLGMAGRLPETICPKACVGQQDFVALDYYWGTGDLAFWRIPELASSAERGRFDLAPVWPGGLYHNLRWLQGLFGKQEIVIVENGCVPRADGLSRAEYLERHVLEVRRAIAEGANVTAYVCWSLTSNREWGQPFGPGTDFGLYHIDLDAEGERLERLEHPDAGAFRRIVERR